ncbi:MAG: helix-turn-helix domain-containing protein [Proteobacteria bacterium]|nr:helix-turn-helix domain-containing protein [Pseudomonadota bacterium]
MTKIDNDLVETGRASDGKAPTDEVRFGAMFRAARESSGFTIERAAMATRISQPFIEALEKEAFDKLPGAVFGRGFIRNLCKTYGKDSTDLLASFEYLTNTVKGKDIAISHRDEKRHQQLKKGVLLIQPNEWKGRIKALAPHHYLRAKPLALIVGAFLIVAFLVKLINQEENQVASLDNLPKIEEKKEVPVDPGTPVVDTKVSTTTVPEAAPALPKPASTPETLPSSTTEVLAADKVDGLQDLELRVKQPVTVKITKDSEKQTTEQLQPNSYHYRFKDQLKLYIEDMSAMDIYFQGQKIPNTANKGESRRLSFQAAESNIAKKVSAPRL